MFHIRSCEFVQFCLHSRYRFAFEHGSWAGATPGEGYRFGLFAKNAVDNAFSVFEIFHTHSGLLPSLVILSLTKRTQPHNLHASKLHWSLSNMIRSLRVQTRSMVCSILIQPANCHKYQMHARWRPCLRYFLLYILYNIFQEKISDVHV